MSCGRRVLWHRVASRSRALEAPALKQRHYHWLLQTGQDEEAARVKEGDGDFVGAITLFLQGGLPAKAAQVPSYPSPRGSQIPPNPLPLYSVTLPLCLTPVRV